MIDTIHSIVVSDVTVIDLQQILQNFKVEYDHEDIGAILRIVNVPDKPLRLKFIDLPWSNQILSSQLTS